MKPSERAGMLAYTKLPVYQRRIQQAESCIQKALNINDLPWCVSFSGGKDSTVMLDMALKQSPDIDIAWMDDGWDYPETIQFVADTETRLGRNIIRVSVPVTAPIWKENGYICDDPAYPHPVDVGYKEWQKSRSMFIGMRKQESRDRERVLRTRGMLYKSATWGHWRCCPLANCKTEDIWGYILERDLPYNPVYDKLEEMRVDIEHRRVGPVTAWMVYQYGILGYLRWGWPDLYARFMAYFPALKMN